MLKVNNQQNLLNSRVNVKSLLINFLLVTYNFTQSIVDNISNMLLAELITVQSLF